MEAPPPPAGTAFRTERWFPAPPAAVFGAFADAEQLARWWGPDGFRNTFDVFEFAPGGRWVFVMHGPGDSHYPNECVFQDIDAARGVVIRHGSNPPFTLNVSWAARDVGTAVTWVQAFDDATLAQNIRHIIEPANEQNLNRLQALLAENTAATGS